MWSLFKRKREMVRNIGEGVISALEKLWVSRYSYLLGEARFRL